VYYCPRCGTELESADVLVCSKCDAQFGPEAAWKPLTTRPEPALEGWGAFRDVVATLLLLIGYGVLALFVLFLVFLFPRGTSSGSVLGLMMIGPPLGIGIAVLIVLGHAIKPRKGRKSDAA